MLVRHVREGVTESVHRGDIAEADANGRLLHVVGDPDRLVNLRSAVKPFGIVALLRAGGQAEFDLTTEELAVMVASHSGEDLHVRTLMGLYRRANLPQSVLACGTEGPIDTLTAARLARDGERPGPLRHQCSGQHSSFLLLARMGGWDLDGYWQPDHPAHAAYVEVVAATFGVPVSRLVTGVDACGIYTFAFPLRDVARAYAMLADPDAIDADDSRHGVARHLRTVRDAMIAHPEQVAGTRDRLDTSLMKAAPRPPRGEGRRRGAHLRRDPARDPRRGVAGLGVRAQDRGRGRASRGPATPPRSRGSARPARSRARRSACSPATTGRPPWTPTGGSWPRRSPSFELAPVGELG